MFQCPAVIQSAIITGFDVCKLGYIWEEENDFKTPKDSRVTTRLLRRNKLTHGKWNLRLNVNVWFKLLFCLLDQSLSDSVCVVDVVNDTKPIKSFKEELGLVVKTS